MHIGYVPRERPPFSVLNFRTGAYHFHKWPKNRFLPFRMTIIVKISLISTRSPPRSHGRLSPLRSAAPRVSAGQARVPARRFLAVPETRIFTLYREARSGAWAGRFFTLPRHTYIPKFGVSTRGLPFPDSVRGIFPGPASNQKVYQGNEWFSQLAGQFWACWLKN